MRGDLQQAAEDHGDGVLTLTHAEVQHVPGMTGVASRRRLRAQLLDQPGLTDPGFPADADRGSGTRFEDGVQRTPELPHLVVASNERSALCTGRAQAAHAPHAQRLVESLDRDLTEPFGIRQVRHRRVQSVRNERLTRLRQRVEPGGEIDGISRHGVLRLCATRDDGSHDLAAGDPDV